jgi:hypothetical protein
MQASADFRLAKLPESNVPIYSVADPVDMYVRWTHNVLGWARYKAKYLAVLACGQAGGKQERDVMDPADMSKNLDNTQVLSEGLQAESYTPLIAAPPARVAQGF